MRVNLSSLDEILFIFSNFIIEKYILTHKHLRHFLDDEKFALDHSIFIRNEFGINEKVTIDIDHKGERWEFKNAFSKEAQKRQIMELKIKFKNANPPINVIVFLINSALPTALRMTELEKNVFRILYEQILKLFKTENLTLLKERHFVKYSFDSPNYEDVIANSVYFETTESKMPKMIHITPNENDILKAFELSAPKIQKYFINNFLRPEDIMDNIEIPEKQTIKVDQKDRNSVWNRDMNKDQQGNGRAATRLMIVPNIERYEITHKDVDKFCSEEINIKFKNSLRKILTVDCYYLEDLNKIRSYVKLLAFFQSTRHIDKANKKIEEIKLIIKNLNILLQKKILSERKIKISFNGLGVNVKLDKIEKDYLGIQKKSINKFNKGRNVISGDWFRYHKLFKTYCVTGGDPQLNIPDCSNAYPFNENLNNLSDQINESSRYTLKKIIHSDVGKILNRERLIYRSLAIGSYSGSYYIKNYANLCIVNNPLKYFYLYASGNPNQIVSGSVLRVIKVKKEHKFEDLEFGDFLKFSLDDIFELIVFKPTRVHWESCLQADSDYASWLGTQNLFLNQGVDLLDNDLFNSLFCKFTEQLFATTDLIYTLYRQLQAFNNYGKNKMKDKLGVMLFDDIRHVSIITRLKSSYKLFVRTYQKGQRKEAKEMKEERINIFNVLNLIDPIYEFKHTNEQTIFGVTYGKQSFKKKRGVVEAKYMSNFFEKNMEYNSEYKKSPFKSKNKDDVCKWYMDMHPTYFSDNMFDEKGNINRISFFPQAICYAINNMILDVVARKDVITVKNDIINTLNTEAMALSTPSKCFITTKLTDINPYGERDKKKDIQGYPGLRSINCYLAMEMEEAYVKKMFNDINFPEFYNQYIKYNVKERPLTILELYVGIMNYHPYFDIAALVIKWQRDRALRNFYMQTTLGVYGIKILDRIFKPILENHKYDMILLPGNSKYVKFQKDGKKILATFGCYTLTLDMEKFGELYPNECLRIVMYVLYKKGIITYTHFILNNIIIDSLTNRRILLPMSLRKLFKVKEENDIEVKFWNSKDGKNEYLFQKYPNLLQIMSQPELNRTTYYDQVVKENPHIIVEPGGILGSLNIAWSTLSAGAHVLLLFLMNFFGFKDIFISSTHSDDHIICTNLRIKPRNRLYQSYEHFSSWFEVKNNLSVQRVGNDWMLYNGKSIKDDDVFVLLTIGVFFCLKSVGQTPSLTKCFPSFSAEILQTKFDNEFVYVPLIRYCTTLLNELPHVSPDNDISAASGRIYDLVVNGGNQVLIGTQLLIMNMMIWETWGGCESGSVNNITEMQGFYWSIPAFIINHGFNANLIRLLSNENNRNKIVLGFNTREIWKPLNFKEKTQIDVKILTEEEFKEIEKLIDEEDEEKSETTETVDNNNESGDISVFRSIKISYARKFIVQKTFTDLYNLHKVHISEFAKTNKIDILDLKPDKIIRKIRKDWIIFSNSGLKNSIITILSHLSALLSQVYSDNIVKKFESVKTISMLGYKNRKFLNPFSEKAQKILDFKKEIVTTSEIWAAYASLVNLGITSKTGEKFYNFFLRLYNQEILFLRTYDIKNITYTEKDFGYKGTYKKITIEGLIRTDERYLKKMLTCVLEIMLENISVNNTFTMKTNLSLQSNDLFIENVQRLKEAFEESNINAQLLKEHFELFLRIFKNHDIRGVICTKGTKDVIIESLSNYHGNIKSSFTVQIKDDFNMIDQKLFKVKENQKVINKLLILKYWIDTVYATDSYISKVTLYEIPTLVEFVFKFQIIVFTKASANAFLALILMNNVHRNQVEIYGFYDNSQRIFTDIFFRFDIFTIRLRYFGTWRCEFTTAIPVDLDVIHFICQCLTYWMANFKKDDKERRIKSYQDYETTNNGYFHIFQGSSTPRQVDPRRTDINKLGIYYRTKQVMNQILEDNLDRYLVPDQNITNYFVFPEARRYIIIPWMIPNVDTLYKFTFHFENEQKEFYDYPIEVETNSAINYYSITLKEDSTNIDSIFQNTYYRKMSQIEYLQFVNKFFQSFNLVSEIQTLFNLTVQIEDEFISNCRIIELLTGVPLWLFIKHLKEYFLIQVAKINNMKIDFKMPKIYNNTELDIQNSTHLDFLFNLLKEETKMNLAQKTISILPIRDFLIVILYHGAKAAANEVEDNKYAQNNLIEKHFMQAIGASYQSVILWSENNSIYKYIQRIRYLKFIKNVFPNTDYFIPLSVIFNFLSLLNQLPNLKLYLKLEGKSFLYSRFEIDKLFLCSLILNYKILMNVNMLEFLNIEKSFF